MSSNNNYEPRAFEASFTQIINLNNNSGRKTRGKYTKLACSYCKDTNDSVNQLSNKVNKIEEIITNFKNRPRNKPELSLFNAKFTLNNVPCELEYDLSNFTLENLQKLASFTTQSFNNNIVNNDNEYGNSSDKIKKNED
ncbi:uncharacterized protein OCT59_002956 [Rhizophagus irregularis]|uniref:Uncharacterized protein n=3 Tax=Rhizophagus irregularis TaxID=588596 RepID=U9T830_RHIID|nr:hypothetical protein GLOIN_2v1779544 [Rhizophagus irregularis DAOM 181602=DAOM 197198]EXX65258.1 hypothetical protein RirG_134970 [Rhizophagus irregularis DAOM 197198w]PKY17513.1 hypothetical protein RhiirB3_430157 [Rhizophagus irregularis]POG67310.1 hypothetical protein GLOIN_2v1779544 [Rhizophagus irregularis DAOM 181602=DAOM 197198]UZO11387.1 hypothetical protein OCT59_002956 [Rhizophagus irregularis]CAB5383306.1 unnamed protein product [Rhizophagus irregularis]|eukprot:XP_025174176.1 hypothetical protein GLOIN_2v1779544 [Rhizophagus irregularis DAOM 181602=DAOM 197198]